MGARLSGAVLYGAKQAVGEDKNGVDGGVVHDGGDHFGLTVVTDAWLDLAFGSGLGFEWG